MEKKVLLIGGGGTIGTYVAKELLEKGCYVDILCLEDYTSDNKKLRYIKAEVTLDYLKEFLKDKHYDSIMDLLHHPVPEDYIAFHMEIAPKTDHEIFVSSIRAIGNAEHPIKETSPTILDLYERGEFTDEEYIANDDYSLSKTRCERYLRQVSKYKNWTIVRPMINSSDKRLDIVMHTFHRVIEYAKSGKTLYAAAVCKDKVAGLEWAGNTGKMVANIMFKKECMGKTYMLSTGHKMTWDNVADVYRELLGLKLEWVSENEYDKIEGYWKPGIDYDRSYDRYTDNSEMLKATGLTENDFVPFKEGIKSELKKLGVI